MPTKAEYDALAQRLSEAQVTLRHRAQELQGFKDACTFYEERIKALETERDVLKAERKLEGEPWMVPLYVNNGFLGPLRDAMLSGLTHAQSKYEVFQRLIASLPMTGANRDNLVIISAGYEAQATALRELLDEVEKALRDG